MYISICLYIYIYLFVYVHIYICMYLCVCVYIRWDHGVHVWQVHACVMACVSWLIHLRVMTHPCVCHDSFMCVSWLIYMCLVTRACVIPHSCVRHDSFTCISWHEDRVIVCISTIQMIQFVTFTWPYGALLG